MGYDCNLSDDKMSKKVTELCWYDLTELIITEVHFALTEGAKISSPRDMFWI